MQRIILATLIVTTSASITPAAVLFNTRPDTTETHPAPSPDIDAPRAIHHPTASIHLLDLTPPASSDYQTADSIAVTSIPFATDSSPPDPYTSGLLGLPPCGVALLPENDFAPAAVVPFLSHPIVPEPANTSLLALGALICVPRRRSPPRNLEPIQYPTPFPV